MRISDWSSDLCSSDLKLKKGRIRMRASGLLTSVSIFIVAGVPLFGCPAFAQASDEEVSNPAPASTAEANAVSDSNAAQSGGLADIIVTARRSSERSEEHTSELQSLMRISYAVFCLKKK